MQSDRAIWLHECSLSFILNLTTLNLTFLAALGHWHWPWVAWSTSITERSSSLDLVGVLVGASVVLRLGVWSISSLLERRAEVVAPLVVLAPGLSLASPPDGEVLLVERQGLKELDLLEADLLEELGVSLVVFEH